MASCARTLHAQLKRKVQLVWCKAGSPLGGRRRFRQRVIMAFRVLRILAIVLTVFLVSYLAWFSAWAILVPAEFGMPEYEDEIELAFLVGSVIFGIVPLLVCIIATDVPDQLRARRSR